MWYKQFLLSTLCLLFPVLNYAQTGEEGQDTTIIKTILYIGDSITDGLWGNSGGGPKPSAERNHWDQNHIYGHGYMCFSAVHFQSLYPERNIVCYNRGISGDTLADLEKRWDKDMIALRPDILSILIGTNDADRYLKVLTDSTSFDFDNWKSRYQALIDLAKENNPKLHLVLCTPFVANVGNMKQTNNFAERDRIVRTLAEKIEELALENQAILVPFDKLIDNLLVEEKAPQDTYWIWDGIHPTMVGHRRMADLWIEMVAPVLASNNEVIGI